MKTVAFLSIVVNIALVLLNLYFSHKEKRKDVKYAADYDFFKIFVVNRVSELVNFSREIEKELGKFIGEIGLSYDNDEDRMSLAEDFYALTYEKMGDVKSGILSVCSFYSLRLESHLTKKTNEFIEKIQELAHSIHKGEVTDTIASDKINALVDIYLMNVRSVLKDNMPLHGRVLE